MKVKLQQFLDEAFAPYGDFPAREDVLQELLTNLQEKFEDLKAQGKSDDDAYQAATGSFGDVAEIMQQIPLAEESKTPLNVEFFKKMVFDKADLTGAVVHAASLKGASFIGATLKYATLSSSDLRNVQFDAADLTGATIKASGLKGASFAGARLVNTRFSKSDLSGISFDGQTLEGVVFDSSSLKKTSFRKAVLRRVSFRFTAVKQAIFDGTTMDQPTYDMLQNAGATLKDCHVK